MIEIDLYLLGSDGQRRSAATTDRTGGLVPLNKPVPVPRAMFLVADPINHPQLSKDCLKNDPLLQDDGMWVG